MTRLVAVVPHDMEYIDRSLATASWYDRLSLKAGEYEVKPVTIDGRDAVLTDDPERYMYYGDLHHYRPYYGKIDVPAVVLEEHRVNRFLSETRVETTHPNTERVHSFRPYWYQVKSGHAVHGDWVDGEWKPTIVLEERD